LRLISYEGGFGRVQGSDVVPMGADLGTFLCDGRVTEGTPVALASVRQLPPVPRPGKIICVGLNYRQHAIETGTPIQAEPPLFAKFANSLVADGEAIRVPAATEQPDWEAELGVVIGRIAAGVDVDEALSHVAGYLCLNDVSARDLQVRTSQWTRGKAIDTFLPAGPWLTTADEVPDPQTLRISSLVNGEVMQDSTTADMIWGVADLVAFISQVTTLEPGDIIATGTPPGVGSARTPPRWLHDGDEVTVEVERLGSITNRVVRVGADPQASPSRLTA
jgi:2-keto-4-pentenoate hydratase/2-oxohepta-3-ene-1,7-dioic acid hydratase in catechol pathway